MTPQFLVNTKEDFDAIIEYLKDEDIFGLDTETNGKWSQFQLNLVGISLGFDDFCCYIPLTHVEGEQLPLEYVIGKLKPILEDPETRYVCHNTKFDEKVLKIYGIDCQGSGDDTLVLCWLLDEEGSHGLKAITQRYLGVKMETYEDVIKKQRHRRSTNDHNFARVSLDDALSYAAADAYFTLRLYRIFRERVHLEKLWDAYINIERPLIRILRDMELRGILIDQRHLKYAAVRYPELMEELAAEIYEEAGEVFNLDSSTQLGPILYEKLGIGTNVRKTATGRYSTDKKTLTIYAGKHHIVENILRRKKIKKTYDVYVKGLSEYVEENGRVYPQFNSTGTVTGRFSGSSPSLQQVQGDEVEEIKVRDFFIPSPGYIFIVGDYGQIELRVMAHFAKDIVAIAAFNSGRDFHNETAREMYGVDTPTARQRFFAKALNFGIPYGRGPISVAETLDIKVGCKSHDCGECGACYIQRWFGAFPAVKPYKEALIRRTRSQGFMRTISGRKRRLAHICSPDPKLRFGAERQAFNTLCQGSAADIIKLGMVQVAPRLKALDAHILIQVHDELVVEAPIENAEKVVEELKEVMEYPLGGLNPLSLPLKFDPKIVEHWSEAK